MNQKTQFRSTKRSGDYENKRLILLREAARLFIEKGVQQTSLDDVVENLGISKPALYYYFKSKDEIISECLARGHKNDEENVKRIFETLKSGPERLKALCQYYTRTITDDFGRCIVLIELNSLSPEGQERFLKSQRFLYGEIKRLISEGVAEGSFNECNETVTAFALIGALNSSARWFVSGKGLEPDEIADQIYRTFANGVVK